MKNNPPWLKSHGITERNLAHSSPVFKDTGSSVRINKKNVDYYLNLPWTYTIETTKENGETLYVICVNELPGICTDAPTVAEAMILIKDAMLGAFELYLENGEEIPEPIDEDQYKGNIAYRTSSKRHYAIAREAQKRKSSLSKIIDKCIDESLRK